MYAVGHFQDEVNETTFETSEIQAEIQKFNNAIKNILELDNQFKNVYRSISFLDFVNAKDSQSFEIFVILGKEVSDILNCPQYYYMFRQVVCSVYKILLFNLQKSGVNEEEFAIGQKIASLNSYVKKLQYSFEHLNFLKNDLLKKQCGECNVAKDVYLFLCIFYVFCNRGAKIALIF